MFIVNRYIAELSMRWSDIVKGEFFLSSQLKAMDFLGVLYVDGLNNLIFS